MQNTYRKTVLKRLLTESPKEDPVDVGSESDEVVAARKKYEDQVSDLLKVFPTAPQKAMLTLLISLGAPIAALKIHKIDIKDGISAAAEKYRKNSAFRMWTNKLMLQLSAQEQVNEDEVFKKQLTNKYQRVIYDIMVAIGLPEVVEKTANRALKTGIKNSSAVMLTNDDARIALMNVAEQLGVTEIDNAPVRESRQQNLNESNSDDALQLVNKLLTVFGFEMDKNISLTAQEKRSNTRRALMKLASNPSLMRRLDMVINLIDARVNPMKNSSLAEDLTHEEKKNLIG